MASAYIRLDGTAGRYASSVRRLVDILRDAQELAQECKDVGDQIALGGDWPALAVALGVTESESEAVYNLLGSVNTELHGTFSNQLVSRLG